ncbi:MAG: M23 family metallopeptidase [Candidatus Nanoarchaeia archaeon]|nr:M23 family metallopeptidase [Candidatus Nanoarchaeia archaeon]
MKAKILICCAVFSLIFAGCTTSGSSNPSNLQYSRQLLLWPIGCNSTHLCIGILFPDVDSDNISYSCQNLTYLGHTGTDIAITQEDMDAGIPVYASLDGVVLWAYDGKYDRCPDENELDCLAPLSEPSPESSEGYRICTEKGDYCRKDSNLTDCAWCNIGGNFIVILHDNHLVFGTKYDHLKNGSITVKPGDVVKQGDIIAMAGSSGNSEGPHLHFEVWSDFFTAIDPWNGPCGTNKDVIYWMDRAELGKHFITG